MIFMFVCRGSIEGGKGWIEARSENDHGPGKRMREATFENPRIWIQESLNMRTIISEIHKTVVIPVIHCTIFQRVKDFINFGVVKWASRISYHEWQQSKIACLSPMFYKFQFKQSKLHCDLHFAKKKDGDDHLVKDVDELESQRFQIYHPWFIHYLL
jgi:hypothetical protein